MRRMKTLQDKTVLITGATMLMLARHRSTLEAQAQALRAEGLST